MTHKYEDLERFCANILDKNNGNREIGFHTLEHEIAKNFGWTKYKMENVKNALFKFGLIERLGMADRFKITYLEKPKDAEKEAKKEIDDLFDKITPTEGNADIL